LPVVYSPVAMTTNCLPLTSKVIGGGVEARAHIGLPELVKRDVVICGHGSIRQTEEDQAAAGRQGAADWRLALIERSLVPAQVEQSSGRQLHHFERGAAHDGVGIAQGLTHFEVIVALADDELDRLSSSLERRRKVVRLAVKLGRL
jgi:hypothetical protein